MAVRVKLRIISKSRKEVVTSALVNSGFEAETPQLLIPKSLATLLDLWPPPIEAQLVEVGTAGGIVYVETEDRKVGPVECDAMISLLEHEVLISDRLGGELGLVILDLRGKWRFSGEDGVRTTETPQYWF